MHAIRLHELGPAENLQFEQVPDPVPAPGQVRIVVEASGVHLLDTMLRSGAGFGPMPPVTLPTIPGREVAGVVDEVGPDVEPGWIGRRVVAHLGMVPGGYAQKAVASAATAHVLPESVSFPAAVAMIGTGRTAMGVLELAGLVSDDVVVIPAAAGGLGSLFVQATRNAGAVAVGIAGSAAKVALVRDLGAEIAVDHHDVDWADQITALLGDRKGSLVLDGVGGATGRAAFDLLGTAGRIVTFGWSSGALTEFTSSDLSARGLTASGMGPRLLARPGGWRDLETLALAEAAAGHLVPVVQEFALADAPAAHRALESGQTVGKVVLV